MLSEMIKLLFFLLKINIFPFIWARKNKDLFLKIEYVYILFQFPVIKLYYLYWRCKEVIGRW